MGRYERPEKMSDRQRRLRYAGRRAMRIGGLLAVVGVVISAGWFGVFGTRPRGDAETYGGKEFRGGKVVDGDTLDVGAPDERRGYPSTRVRLWGVDTPETVKPDTAPQHFGPEAAAFTRELCADRTVRLELDPRNTRDRYGRLLAYVHLPDGRMLNRLLVAQGYAYADPRFDHRCRAEFRSLQRAAIKDGRGLWKDARPADLPYYYRSLKLTPRTGPR